MPARESRDEACASRRGDEVRGGAGGEQPARCSRADVERVMKNAPANVSSPVHAPYAINSEPIQRRADSSASTPRRRGAAAPSGTGAALRAVSSAASASAAGTASATRHDTHCVIAPTAGLTTIHASAFAPAT